MPPDQPQHRGVGFRVILAFVWDLPSLSNMAKALKNPRSIVRESMLTMDERVLNAPWSPRALLDVRRALGLAPKVFVSPRLSEGKQLVEMGLNHNVAAVVGGSLQNNGKYRSPAACDSMRIRCGSGRTLVMRELLFLTTPEL